MNQNTRNTNSPFSEFIETRNNEFRIGDNTLESSSPLLLPKPEVGFSLADLEIGEEGMVEFIAGMFPKGRVSALVGESGIGKSWGLIAASLTITDSISFLPIENYELKNGRRVLIVDTEGRIVTYRKRIEDLGGTTNNFIIPNSTLKIPGFKSSADRKQIEQIIQVDKPDLVIFDSFAGFSDADENTGSVMPCIKWFTNLAQVNNVAVVFTQLVNKSEQKDGKIIIKQVRGYGGITQFPEIIWAIDNPNPKDETRKRLYQIKNNVTQKDETEYIFVLDDSTITIVDEEYSSKSNKMSIRDKVFQANQDKSTKEIVGLLRKLEPNTKYEALERWVQREKRANVL